jgi:hypothetical protein
VPETRKIPPKSLFPFPLIFPIFFSKFSFSFPSLPSFLFVSFYFPTPFFLLYPEALLARHGRTTRSLPLLDVVLHVGPSLHIASDPRRDHSLPLDATTTFTPAYLDRSPTEHSATASRRPHHATIRCCHCPTHIPRRDATAR